MRKIQKKCLFAYLFLTMPLITIDVKSDCDPGTLKCYKKIPPGSNTFHLEYVGTITNLSCCGIGLFHSNCQPCDDPGGTCDTTYPQCQRSCYGDAHCPTF